MIVLYHSESLLLVLLAWLVLTVRVNKLPLIVDNRQEYDVREERRRELEFLEKVGQLDFCPVKILMIKSASPNNFLRLNARYLQGGNPLDFKFGNAASVSVQSTSLVDQPRELFVTRFPCFLWLIS